METDNQSRTAPERIPLIPYGRNTFTRDGKSGEFKFTEHDADAIIAEFTERARFRLARQKSNSERRFS